MAGEALGTTYRDTRYDMSMRKEVESYVSNGLLVRHEHCHLPLIFFETYFGLGLPDGVHVNRPCPLVCGRWSVVCL